jgi:hypothetical protein
MTRLEVQADLTVDIDGVPGTLTGSGGRLVLETADPRALWSAVTRASLPVGVGRVDAARALGRLADGMRDAGVRLEVRGPRGPLVALGDGVRSVTGRVTTGSSALRPGGAGALGPLILADLRHRRPVRVAAFAALAAAALAVLRRRGR